MVYDRRLESKKPSQPNMFKLGVIFLLNIAFFVGLSAFNLH